MASAPNSIQGLVVLGDPLRPGEDGAPGGTDRQALWLYQAIKGSVTRATNLPLMPALAATDPEIAACVAGLREPYRAADEWAAHYTALPEAHPLAICLAARVRGRICIGYELPRYMTALLDHWRAPYVDLRVHPVRFLDDLLFAARASSEAATEALTRFAAAEIEAWVCAGLRAATLSLLPSVATGGSTLLVIGQRPDDSTQILDGRFFSAAPHMERIAAIAGSFDHILLKPHPDAPYHPLMTAVTMTRPDALRVGDNVYRLLSRDDVAGVLTVNSSVAYEAVYFGKPVHALAPLPIRLAWRGESPAGGTHVSVGDEVLGADFWRAVLAPHVAVTPVDGHRLAAKPNRLRIAMRSFWNFNEIDTDLIPRAGGVPAQISA